MAIDRTTALRTAEKLLRQGKLDLAIAEYSRMVEEDPRDWNTANLLGDLYLRAGDSGKAVDQFARIADSLNAEGFHPKAAALYKKILKIRPDDEHALLEAGTIAGSQGLLVDARAYLRLVLEQRRRRGDERGAAEVRIRLGSLDPDDYTARLDAARARVAAGDTSAAIRDFKAIAAELTEKGRHPESLDALRHAASIDADDPSLLLALTEGDLRDGRLADGLAHARRLLAGDPTRRRDLAILGCALAEQSPDAGFEIVALAVEHAVAQSDWAVAAAVLEEFVMRVPHHIPALMRLVEIGVDGGLDATVRGAQAHLVDAYLSAGSAAEARVIAEDLMAHDPEEPAHAERFRRALALLGEPDPHDIIVERSDAIVEAVAQLEPAAALVVPEPLEPFDLPSRDDAPPNLVARSALSLERAPNQFELSATAIDVERILEELDELDAMPAPPTRPDSVEIDLSIVLDDMRIPPAAPAADLDSVFAQLRDEASHESAPDPANREYQRGLALYKAGQRDECIVPLAAAARAPSLRFAAASLLARIHVEHGVMPQAIEWFERAAEAPAPTPEDGQRLLYDLASALESVGEVARALAILMELRADAGEYRDVVERIDRLTQAQTRG